MILYTTNWPISFQVTNPNSCATLDPLTPTCWCHQILMLPYKGKASPKEQFASLQHRANCAYQTTLGWDHWMTDTFLVDRLMPVSLVDHPWFRNPSSPILCSLSKNSLSHWKSIVQIWNITWWRPLAIGHVPLLMTLRPAWIMKAIKLWQSVVLQVHWNWHATC